MPLYPPAGGGGGALTIFQQTMETFTGSTEPLTGTGTFETLAELVDLPAGTYIFLAQVNIGNSQPSGDNELILVGPTPAAFGTCYGASQMTTGEAAGGQDQSTTVLMTPEIVLAVATTVLLAWIGVAAIAGAPAAIPCLNPGLPNAVTTLLTAIKIK